MSNAAVISTGPDCFSGAIRGAEPSGDADPSADEDTQRGRVEGDRTGEGLPEVSLWEEAQAAFGKGAALKKRSADEPLVIDGSPQGQDWLAFQTLPPAIGTPPR